MYQTTKDELGISTHNPKKNKRKKKETLWHCIQPDIPIPRIPIVLDSQKG